MSGEAVREEIIRQLIATGKFDRKYAYISERSGYRCEYCQRALLADEAVGMWCIDHVVPRSKEGSSNHQDNLAIACVVCNNLKGEWDPRKGAADSTRDSMIAVAKVHIDEQRIEAEEHLRLM